MKVLSLILAVVLFAALHMLRMESTVVDDGASGGSVTSWLDADGVDAAPSADALEHQAVARSDVAAVGAIVYQHDLATWGMSKPRWPHRPPALERNTAPG